MSIKVSLNYSWVGEVGEVGSKFYCQGGCARLFIGSSTPFPILSTLPCTVMDGSLSTKIFQNPLPGFCARLHYSEVLEQDLECGK